MTSRREWLRGPVVAVPSPIGDDDSLDLGGLRSYPLEIWDVLERHDYRSIPALLGRFKWGWSRWAGRVAARTGGEGPFIKAAMRLAGLAAGPPRPPAIEPGRELLDELRELFEAADVPRAVPSMAVRGATGAGG